MTFIAVVEATKGFGGSQVAGRHSREGGGPRKHRAPWFRKGRFWSLLLLALFAGPIYQQFSQAWDRLRFDPPGQLVEVNGRNMHVHCSGAGEPTVILESGATGFAQAWTWVQAELEKSFRVCSYDRAGLGWSEGEDAHHDGVAAARNLKSLLEKIDEFGPYVMVGHSMGGPLVQIFTGLYPEDVAAIGLVDPSHPEQNTRYREAAHALNEFAEKLQLASLLSYTGLLRLTNALAANAEGLPSQAYEVAHLFAASPRHLLTSYRELAAWESTMSAARKNVAWQDKPLTVISATEARDDFPKSFVRAFQTLHADLAAMSADAQHLTIPGSNHFTLVTDRRYARETADAIEELIVRAKGQAAQAAGSADAAQGRSPR